MTKFKNSMVAAFIAVAAIGCGELSEDVTAYENGYNTPAPSAPADPVDTTTDSDSDAELIKDGCEAFGLVYDAANNTCVDDEHETNIIAPAPEPELIVDGCEAFGLVEENGTCVNPTSDILVTGTDENEYNDILNPFNFTVTPGKKKLVATWITNDAVSSFRIERTREGNSYSNDSYPSGTEWTYASFSCSAHSFNLVATMLDGTVIESGATDYLKPTNCE